MCSLSSLPPCPPAAVPCVAEVSGGGADPVVLPEALTPEGPVSLPETWTASITGAEVSDPAIMVLIQSS